MHLLNLPSEDNTESIDFENQYNIDFQTTEKRLELMNDPNIIETKKKAYSGILEEINKQLSCSNIVSFENKDGEIKITFKISFGLNELDINIDSPTELMKIGKLIDNILNQYINENGENFYTTTENSVLKMKTNGIHITVSNEEKLRDIINLNKEVELSFNTPEEQNKYDTESYRKHITPQKNTRNFNKKLADFLNKIITKI